MLAQTKALVEKCNCKLGIMNGPVYYQIILTKSGPRIVEVTPRLDGCHMWRLIKLASGVDLLDACIKQLTGDTLPDLYVNSKLPGLYLGFFYYHPGKEFFQEAYQPSKDVDYLEYYYSDGEMIRQINGFYEKVGYYIEKYL